MEWLLRVGRPFILAKLPVWGRYLGVLLVGILGSTLAKYQISLDPDTTQAAQVALGGLFVAIVTWATTDHSKLTSAANNYDLISTAVKEASLQNSRVTVKLSDGTYHDIAPMPVPHPLTDADGKLS